MTIGNTIRHAIGKARDKLSIRKAVSSAIGDKITGAANATSKFFGGPRLHRKLGAGKTNFADSGMTAALKHAERYKGEAGATGHMVQRVARRKLQGNLRTRMLAGQVLRNKAVIGTAVGGAALLGARHMLKKQPRNISASFPALSLALFGKPKIDHQLRAKRLGIQSGLKAKVKQLPGSNRLRRFGQSVERIGESKLLGIKKSKQFANAGQHAMREPLNILGGIFGHKASQHSVESAINTRTARLATRTNLQNKLVDSGFSGLGRRPLQHASRFVKKNKVGLAVAGGVAGTGIIGGAIHRAFNKKKPIAASFPNLSLALKILSQPNLELASIKGAIKTAVAGELAGPGGIVMYRQHRAALKRGSMRKNSTGIRKAFHYGAAGLTGGPLGLVGLHAMRKANSRGYYNVKRNPDHELSQPDLILGGAFKRLQAKLEAQGKSPEQAERKGVRRYLVGGLLATGQGIANLNNAASGAFDTGRYLIGRARKPIRDLNNTFKSMHLPNRVRSGGQAAKVARFAKKMTIPNAAAGAAMIGLAGHWANKAHKNLQHNRENKLSQPDLVLSGAFKRLQAKLEAQGKSPEQAGGIAYKVGEEKYGKAGMEAKSLAGRKRKMKKKYAVALSLSNQMNEFVKYADSCLVLDAESRKV